MPVVLVETAFISNKDEAILASAEGQDRIAQAIANGIQNYVGC